MSAPPTGILFYEPRAKPLSTIGLIQPGCYYQFYLTGTTTPANVYSDGQLTSIVSQTPGTGGTTAASDGRLIPLYLNPAVTYRVQLYSAVGVLLEDTDPYIPQSVQSSATIGAILWPQTTAEAAASITPVNLSYPPWDIRRMGVVGDGSTDDTSALQKCFTVGGDWRVFPGAQVRCTSTITGVTATRLYSDSTRGIGLGSLSSLPQAFIIHDFNGTFFDLVGSASSNIISAGFTFDRITFVQKNGDGTGASGSCIRSIQVSNTQKCTWLEVIDCNMELLSGSFNDWTHGIELDGTIAANPNNLRDIFISRLRIVSGSHATDSISIKGVANVYLAGVEANLSKGDLTITGSGGNSSTSIFINGCSFNNINLDLATNIYGAGNSASTVISTANSLNVILGCSCSGSPPTILGTRVYVEGLHSTGKNTVSGNNNFRFEIGANTLESSGPVAIGTNPASTGAIALANAASITARNAANSGDIQALQVDSNNRVRIAPGGSDDVVYGRSPVAVGGGAAATLSTIGGSGPGTAAQFEWLQIYDTAGNKCFIPVWK